MEYFPKCLIVMERKQRNQTQHNTRDTEVRIRVMSSKVGVQRYGGNCVIGPPGRASGFCGDHRARLKSETLELLECLKSWFRLGIFTQQDLHDIVGTMERRGAEAMDFFWPDTAIFLSEPAVEPFKCWFNGLYFSTDYERCI